MNIITIETFVDILLFITALLLMFAYGKSLIKIAIIIAPLVINTYLIPDIVSNYATIQTINIILLIVYFLLAIKNKEEIRLFMHTLIRGQIEPSYADNLKAKAMKYQLICFLAFLVSPWLMYPVLFYTSYKFYNAFRKPLSKKELIKFFCYNLIFILSPLILNYNSSIWLLYFCIPALLYQSEKKDNDSSN